VELQISYSICNDILNHTELYEYKFGKLLIHIKGCFEGCHQNQSTGDYIRYYRLRKGFSTRQLAEQLDIVPATLLGYEQGRFPIPYAIAIKLSVILKINKDLLFDDYCSFIDRPYQNILVSLRKSLGLNQRQFAENAGISFYIYTKWENGSRRPSRKMYERLIAAYPKIKQIISSAHSTV